MSAADRAYDRLMTPLRRRFGYSEDHFFRVTADVEQILGNVREIADMAADVEAGHWRLEYDRAGSELSPLDDDWGMYLEGARRDDSLLMSYGERINSGLENTVSVLHGIEAAFAPEVILGRAHSRGEALKDSLEAEGYRC